MTTHHEPLHIAYIGNFQPQHSTENHVAETLRRMGHHVHQFQEDDPATWRIGAMPGSMPTGPHLVLWTRTGSLTPPPDVSQRLLDELARVGCPSAGFHLDRWWGLNREGQVHESPFFRCDLVATADGGHDQQWLDAGVNHMWLPPAVAEFECGWGSYRPNMASQVAFVGSWQHYHDEWPWRRRLVRLLEQRYGLRGFRAWPQPGHEAVRGAALRDLYASSTVVVGDSCLAGDATRYWSDRIPETLGRGGLLVHPSVTGLDLWYEPVETDELGHHTPGDLVVVEPENIEAMFDAIDAVLAMPVAEQYEIRRRGMLATLQRNTYRHRMDQLLCELERQGLLR